MQRKQTEPYLSMYFHSKGRRLGLPIAGNFELTARCNFNCPMCYVHMSEDDVSAAGKELSAAQWIEIAEKAKEKGMIFALLTGGEPFVRKDFFQIYDAMKAMGIMISINSNGSMLEGDVLEKLLENPPFRINVSLYGGCNETYQRMCGLPVFDRVLKNIVKLKEHGIDVRLNLSITPYNCEDLDKIYEIVEKYQIQVKGSSYMYPPIRLHQDQPGQGNRLSAKDSAKYSVIWDKLRFSDEEFDARAVNMKNLVAVEAGECAVDFDEPDAEADIAKAPGVRCRAGSTSFWMTWDGQMRPCGMMTGPTTYPLEEGFDQAWEELRAETAKIVTPAKCVTCAKKEVCGVCAAVCMAETGAFDQVPEYMCQRTEHIIQETWEAYEKSK